MFDNAIWAFDFDGTLVKNTKFVDVPTNDKHFNEFKLFINPSAFDLNWTIVTSRPIVDRIKIEMVLDKCNAKPTFPIMTQIYDVPKVQCEEEYQIKIDHFKNLFEAYHPQYLIYVDNSWKVIDSITSIMKSDKNKEFNDWGGLTLMTLQDAANTIIPRIGDLK